MAPDTNWQSGIRRDHPRIFLNRDMLAQVKDRTSGVCSDHYMKVKAYALGPPADHEWAVIDRPPPLENGTEVRDWGHQIMGLALVHTLEPERELLPDIVSKLRASAQYYHACYDANESVNWYAFSRAACLCAIDWIWDELSPPVRREVCLSLLEHVDQALHKPDIHRRNGSDYRSGFYGAPSLAWFAGLLLFEEGIDDERAAQFLQKGYEDHFNLLEHRAATSGDDGGEASPTLGYSFGEYPLAQWNFLHTLHSATGRQIAGDWPHIRMFPNYIIWNWLPGDLEFGYGDTPHIDNRLHTNLMHTHMSHIMHFFGSSHPEWAGLARYVRDLANSDFQSGRWPIYPFLLTQLENAPASRGPGVLPTARHFENLGQIFMRSGSGSDDTYALFACGGTLKSHRHYDATHFTIFKNGFIALDSGTRNGNTDNLQNYFAQTVAHNCVLIKMPGEAPSPYWNGDVFGQAGGQNQAMGSKVLAFETNHEFTYVVGDATATCNPDKCRKMIRHFLFLPPAHFVVFDRVETTDETFRKTWLLHHANEPKVSGQSWTSIQNGGRVLVQTLLPADAVLEKVGGPGKEFLADGVNYAIDAGPSQYIRDKQYPIGKIEYDETPELMGRWRMEVSPGEPRKIDLFLHLIHVGDLDMEPDEENVNTVAEDDHVRMKISSGNRKVELELPISDEFTGNIRIQEGDRVIVEKELARDVLPQEGLASLVP
jgi:heparin/heparan-sulfate lyase